MFITVSGRAYWIKDGIAGGAFRKINSIAGGAIINFISFAGRACLESPAHPSAHPPCAINKIPTLAR